MHRNGRLLATIKLQAFDLSVSNTCRGTCSRRICGRAMVIHLRMEGEHSLIVLCELHHRVIGMKPDRTVHQRILTIEVYFDVLCDRLHPLFPIVGKCTREFDRFDLKVL